MTTTGLGERKRERSPAGRDARQRAHRPDEDRRGTRPQGVVSVPAHHLTAAGPIARKDDPPPHPPFKARRCLRRRTPSAPRPRQAADLPARGATDAYPAPCLTAMTAAATPTHRPQPSPMTNPETGCVTDARISEKGLSWHRCGQVFELPATGPSDLGGLPDTYDALRQPARTVHRRPSERAASSGPGRTRSPW